MDPLISTDDLMNLLERGQDPSILDARWSLLGPPGREAYDQGHLPGAVFVDLDTELAAPPGPEGRHPLPAPADLERVLQRAGVSRSRPVVVYDADNGAAAARAWWLLRWAGHEEVAVLDGGYAAWVERGHPVTTEVPTPAPGDFQVRPGSMPVVDADGAARVARAGTLLDARVPERYRGDVEPVDPRAGHIPGAINTPFTSHVTRTGTWRSPGELAEHFRRAGVDPQRPVAAYCGSGINACSVLLALEHAGLTSPDRPAALYPGSWSNWSSDPDRPAATGSQPG
ncbi:sulfurtransferase [Saccharopolyspora rectivirgula]|jgi:thiosulfate/3-mercaptopyruvate sulfurtransferase|uniref:3-mercaptopyruvate sulfurtransferase n=1 Tax=Saccharopolyspora rectivirgula TaxID=28042 RepID=A0A073AZ05_9PSEU|nr:sulfurtransferase [Saccharopolyspora rectivirgula]KEI44297.1 3-mercaptopyruvate sulfurtransferase [Saccharopolyspora rectivirgula]